MLEAISLTKDYGAHRALDALNLRVKPGDVYCLLGANGAGKTTTINLFLNFLTPTAGVARIDGLDATKFPQEIRSRVAYLPEQVMLYPRFSGLENLDYFSRLSGLRYHEAALLDFLQTAGLAPDAAPRPLSGYSKGMRQKVGIAIALARHAKALLLDEPTSGLDPQASYEFSKLIQQLAGAGVAILMATHDLFRVKETGTRAGIMKAGRLAAELDTRELDAAELERIYLAHMHADVLSEGRPA